MKTIKMNISLMLGLLIFFSACAKNKEEAPSRESSGKQNLNLDESDWTLQSNQVSDSLILQSKTLTEEGRHKSEISVRESALEPLNLPSNLKLAAFTVRSKGNVRTRQAVFVAPKLYFYRKADGAQVQAKKMGKNVLIPLHAILVDGFSAQIPRPDGIETVPLPESYRVDLELVKKALIERGYDETTSVGPLDGCVKELAISVAGEKFDVTPALVSDSDFCEINRPFTVNLVVPEEKADFIINDALYMSEIDASASFRVQVGYIDSDTRIQMDRSKIYEKLEASLQGQYPPYVKTEIQAKLKSIIQTEAMNIFIKGDRADIINQLVQTAYNSFVEPFELKSSPDAAKPECGLDGICVSLNYEKNKEQRSLEVGFQQYSTTMTEKTITSLAKPQQILFPEVVFDSVNSEKGEFVDNREGHQNERNLGITVNQGTTLELMLNGFKHEIDNTSVDVNTDTWVRCASRDWTKRCEWNEMGLHVNRTYEGVKETDVKPFAGNILGNPALELVFKFTRVDGTSVFCNLSQMNANGTGSKYIIRVENSPNCTIFSPENDKREVVNVSFINQLRDPNPLKAINGRDQFKRTDTYLRKDAPAEGDTSPLGGQRPATEVQLTRAIKLQIKLLVRKYDLMPME